LLVAVLLLVSVAAIAFAVTSRRGAKRARVRLDDLAQRDLLTGLPTRPVFERDLHAALSAAVSLGRGTGLLLFELNRYGAINDTYGHETGDALMQSVVDQIRPALAEGDRLYRYSGPQFGVLYDGVTTLEGLQQKATELQAALKDPFKVERDSIRLSAS